MGCNLFGCRDNDCCRDYDRRDYYRRGRRPYTRRGPYWESEYRPYRRNRSSCPGCPRLFR